MDESFTKMDIIIIIILSLLVSFIIGFNIIQIIDNKLNSVIINVPPSICKLPEIYVNFDKDNKPIKLNSNQLNVLSNKISEENNNNLMNLDVSNQSNQSNSESLDDNIIEEYGNLNDNSSILNNQDIKDTAIKISENLGNFLIDKSNNNNIIDNNYNTLNNLPYLINQNNSNDGYYPNRVKLITDATSPLLKLEEKNIEIIKNVLNKCKKNENQSVINQQYDGYNKYPNLKTNSYSNITSIGKNLMTPYTSFPVPS